MKIYRAFFITLLFCNLLFVSCSSNSDNKESETKPDEESKNIGVFIDSPVSGIDYETSSYSGKTDEMGRFYYKDGEDVQFSIGDIVLPQTSAESIIHITQLFNSNTDDIRVINLARLLISIDEDQNKDNGIAIGASAFLAAIGVNLNFSSATFETDVSSYLANAGGSTTLISETEAKNHIEDTLEESNSFTSEEEDELLYNCGITCVQRANYSDFVVNFYPRHEQVKVSINTKIEFTIIPNTNTGTGEFNVELFPVKPELERCRMGQGGLLCGDDQPHDSRAVFSNLINGLKFFDEGIGVNPIIFGSAFIDNNNKVSITPGRTLTSGRTYVVHVFANDQFQDFKTWWIFKT